MTTNKPELYELSALLQRQAELFETMGDKDGAIVTPTEAAPLSEGTELHWMLSSLAQQVTRLYDLHRYVINELERAQGRQTEGTKLITEMAVVGAKATDLVARKLKTM